MSWLQLKRGNAAAVAAYTPKDGELIIDTTAYRLVLGDGSTLGGKALSVAKADQISAGRKIALSGAISGEVTTDLADDVTIATALGTGVIDASNAAAGNIGEFLNSQNASAISLTNATIANITQLLLTPGDWDVSGAIQFVNSAAMTSINAGTSMTSASSEGFPNNVALGVSFSAGTHRISLPERRVSIATNSTIYVFALAGFASGTVNATAFIRARRVR